MAHIGRNLMGCMIHKRWNYIYTPAAALVLPEFENAPKTASPHLPPSSFWCFSGAYGRSQEEEVAAELSCLISTVAVGTEAPTKGTIPPVVKP